MRRLLVAVFVLAIAAGTGNALAADKPNPTGTWKWTTTYGPRQMTQTIKLKLEGDKLTGAMVGRSDPKTKIEDVKHKDGELSFSVTRERSGQKITSKYSGKVSGDTIKGKIEGPGRDGKSTTRDWDAKRAEEKKAKSSLTAK